jgi:superfamily II DNA/RNA helicase
VNFDKFDLQIENGRAPTKILTWDQLVAYVPDSETGVRQAVEWYGWDAPMKFQAVAIPCMVQSCRNSGDAKSYTLLQAASGLGKTTSLALSILASVRNEVTALQFMVVSLDGCDEMESYMDALSRFFSVKVAFFKGATPPDNLEGEVEDAQGAQIIVGHPNHILAVLKASQDKLVLQSIEVVLIDDASSLIAEGLVQKVCEINQLCSLFAQHPLRYVVVSDFVQNEAKPALRALKSSLMSKKNMFDLGAQVGRIRKFVKHYVLRGNPEGWVKSLMRLREMIYIPRAVIFCDDEAHFQDLKKKLSSRLRGEDGKEMTVAIMDSQSQSQEQRRLALSAFCKEQQDFLLTRSEPNIFQSSLPRVFWIIHFGIESSNLSWYGCRLLCLDSSLRQKASKGLQHEGVSILFLPPEKKDKDKTTVPKVEKMFGIKFEGLPFGDGLV